MFETKMTEGLNHGLSKLTLDQRILFLNERFNRSVMVSNFSKADQYLAWLLTFSKRSVSLYSALGKAPNQPHSPDQLHSKALSVSKTLQSLTSELYGVVFKEIEGELDDTIGRYDAWITSAHRNAESEDVTPRFAIWREDLGVVQINPLADFTSKQIALAVAEHEIPVNQAKNELSLSARGQDEPKALVLSSNTHRAANGDEQRSKFGAAS